MKKIDYKHAYNEDNQLVNIDEVEKEMRRTHVYKCISCGKELIPKLGDIRTHHFAHKENTACDGESYLHLLAKQIILDRFKSKEPFIVKLNALSLCSEKYTCPFHYEACFSDKTTEIDLHQHYNQFEAEKTVYSRIGKDGNRRCYVYSSSEEEEEHYIADILLWDNNRPQKEPVAIEICVTHACDQPKIDSKLKIIEIKVKNENDIESLKQGDIPEGIISFFNFKKVQLPNVPVNNVNVYSRFALFRSGAAINSTIEDYQYCKDRHVRKYSKSVIELNLGLGNSSGFNNDNDYLIGLAFLINKGYQIRNCMLCKSYKGYAESYTGETFCTRFRQSGTMHPLQKHALNCVCYEPNQSMIAKKIEEAKGIPIEIV